MLLRHESDGRCITAVRVRRRGRRSATQAFATRIMYEASIECVKLGESIMAPFIVWHPSPVEFVGGVSAKRSTHASMNEGTRGGLPW
jgi:hypothetical protein